MYTCVCKWGRGGERETLLVSRDCYVVVLAPVSIHIVTVKRNLSPTRRALYPGKRALSPAKKAKKEKTGSLLTRMHLHVDF